MSTRQRCFASSRAWWAREVRSRSGKKYRDDRAGMRPRTSNVTLFGRVSSYASMSLFDRGFFPRHYSSLITVTGILCITYPSPTTTHLIACILELQVIRNAHRSTVKSRDDTLVVDSREGERITQREGL